MRTGSGRPTFQTIGVDDVILRNFNTLTFEQSSTSGYSTDVVLVMQAGFLKQSNGDFVGINTTGGVPYSFSTKTLGLGDPYEGGVLICQSEALDILLHQTAQKFKGIGTIEMMQLLLQMLMRHVVIGSYQIKII